jgi:rubrerythrin
VRFAGDGDAGEDLSVQSIDSALAVVRRAIHNEITGQRFYSDAAYRCIDPWAKEVFDTLASEEEEHTRLLLLEYEALTTDGRWIDLDTALTSNVEVDITRFRFSEEEPAEDLFPPQRSVEQAVDRRADDLAALAFGIRMEQRAIGLYGDAAETEADRAAREAYQFLVEEETRHYHQLRSHWERLSGTAWPEERDSHSL